MDNNNDAYLDLITHAYQLNPDDKYLGMEYGYELMRVSGGDSAMVAEGYKLMGEYVDSNPDDFYSTAVYASLAAHFDDTERAIEKWAHLHYMQPGQSGITARYAELLGSQRDSASTALALELYDSIEIAEGPGIQLSAQKIQLYYMLNDTAAMLAEARGLQQKNPLSVENNVFAGDIYSSLGRNDSALSFYDRAIELDPSSGLAYYSRANFYRNAGDTTAYDREVYNALVQESLDVEPKLGLLTDYARRLYSDTTQRPRINELFQRLIEIHPHEAEIHREYRDYLMVIHDLEGAAEQTSYALDIDPSNELQWQQLLTLRLMLGDFNEAVSDAQRALHFFPRSADVFLMGAAALQQLNRLDEALAYTKKGLEVADNSDPDVVSTLLTTRGDLFYAKGEADSAFVYYDKAILYNPLNYTAMNNAAYYLACQDRDLDRAEKLITLVVEENPDQSTSLDTYAWVLFKKGEYEAARKVIDRTLDIDDDPSAELYEHAGDIYFMLGKTDEAVYYWRKALDLDPENETLKTKINTKHI